MRHQTSLALSEMLKEAIPKAVAASPAGDVPPEERDSLTQLCVMGAAPTGKEDPKSLVRSLGDATVDRLATRFRSMSSDPILRPVSQFFLLEWAYRHGHLHEDWKWEWDTDREGQAKYRSKSTLDEILKAMETS